MTTTALPPVATYNPDETEFVDAFPGDRYLLPLPAGVDRPSSTRDVPRTEDCLVVFRGEDGDWYWHLQAAGNRLIIGGGLEGYRRRGRAVELAERVCRRAAVVLEG